MKTLVIIKADTNDADYIHSIRKNLTKKEIGILEKAAPIIKANGGEWPNSEYADSTPLELYDGQLTEEEIDYINDICPYGEYGIHSIESITIYQVESETRLL